MNLAEKLLTFLEREFANQKLVSKINSLADSDWMKLIPTRDLGSMVINAVKREFVTYLETQAPIQNFWDAWGAFLKTKSPRDGSWVGLAQQRLDRHFQKHGQVPVTTSGISA